MDPTQEAPQGVMVPEPAHAAHEPATAVAPAPVPVPAAAPAPAPERVPVDVLILTYNEEANVPHALRSVVGWASRVFVIDSGSTDRTVEIARAMGAEVISHDWEGYARQKNWALDHLPIESPWVLILDADEAVTTALEREIRGLCSRPADEVPEAGFYVNRYLVFMGQRIRHCGYFPSWNLRLFKRGAARYEDRAVHEHMVLEGEAGYLRGLLSHEDRRGLEYYIAKHNRYSTLEAETIFYARTDNRAEVQPRAFGNAVERRRFFKTKIYPKLPAKWFGRFMWMYVLKLGFLDGMAGLRFCLLISSHELFTSLKLRELQYRAKLARWGHADAPRPTSDVQVIDGFMRRTDADPVAALGPAQSNGSSPKPDNGSPATTPQPVPAYVVAELKHERSPWTLRQKVSRVVWMFVRSTLFRFSFHNWYGWRRLLLRAFGARVGRGVRIRPTAHVEIPWNLDIGDESVVGDHAILYSLGTIRVGRMVVISQYAHLCAGTHDYTDRTFPLLTPPIRVEDEAWVAADAFIGPGVTVGARSVVGARATVVKDVPPDQVVAGNPAHPVKRRAFRN